MIRLTIQVKDPATPALQQALARIKNLSVPNRQVGIKLFQWVEDNFQAQGAMGGGWPPLSDKTQTDKVRLGYSPMPLIRTGNLRQSFAGWGNESEAGVGARASFGVDYARVHQEGYSGTVEVPAHERHLRAKTTLGLRSVKGKSMKVWKHIRGAQTGEVVTISAHSMRINIPARPMLPPAETAREIWMQVYTQFLDDMINEVGLR